MAKKKYLEESERKLIESVNNAYIPTDWDEFEKRYHEMERYGDGKPRKVDKEKMEYIEDGLVSRGIGGNQLSSLLSTIVEESGGNPFSVDDSGKFRGLIQFSKERYPEKDFSRDKKAGWKKAVDNQLDAIVDHLNEYGGDYGFLDGGDGSGYMTGEEAKDAFWGRDSDIENVTRALTYGFVRPGDRSGTTENRTRVARLINEIIQPPAETPDILEFDYDGKHYKATKPEEVTPEMRRALMLSKLVGEKNKVELQDPLYTTFDEAYGRAKNKGARLFMWNGKKYSTKKEGGEVKDMEKFGEMLESLYNEDVERVRNGERAQYFGILNDKPLENVYPEFDLISKPTNVVYKGADMIANPISKVASSGASGFLERELAGPVYWTKKLGDFMKALYFGVTRPIFNSLPESAKPLARQVFKHLYQWRHFTLPDTVRLSRELFGGEDEPESFDAAFKAAREQGLDKFEWNGNEYTTDVREEGGKIDGTLDIIKKFANYLVHPKDAVYAIMKGSDGKSAMTLDKVYKALKEGNGDYSGGSFSKFAPASFDYPKMYVYGEAEGAEELSDEDKGYGVDYTLYLKKIGVDPSTVRQYKGRIGQDVYLPESYKEAIDELISSKDNPTLSYTADYTSDNVAHHLGRINKDKNGDYVMAYSDIWDFYPGDYTYMWGEDMRTKLQSWLLHKSGNPFIVRSKKKIHFIPDDQYGDYINELSDYSGEGTPGEGEAYYSQDTERQLRHIFKKLKYGDGKMKFDPPSISKLLKVVLPNKKEGGWTKENEEDFQEWYAKIAEYKHLNPDPNDENQYYDYRTYWLENPEAAKAMIEGDPEAHFTDRYKYPGHPTFSNESMYSDEEHPGGHWETVDGIGYYVPSEYTKSYIDRTLEYLAGQNEGVYIDGEYKLIPKMPDGGASRLAPRDNTSVGRPGSADVRSVKPSAAARENPVVPFVASLLPGIGDVIDAHDFIQAARDKNMVGMALAASGFIPLVGDAFQEASRFARGRRNSYVRYDAPPRRNDIKESDEELLRKMPDYARPGYPAMEALNVHRRRLSDGAYEQRTGVTGEEAKRELEGFAETFPGIYDRIFDLDYINEDDMEAARRVIEIIDKQPKGSAGTMSDEGVVKRLNDIKQRLVRSSPAFAEGIKGNSGIISLDNWSDFFMDEAYRSGISHELDHAVYLNTPEETIKELSGKVGDWFDSSRIENKNIRDYVSKPIELLARGTQIKDFYGLTDNAEKVTPEMLKFAARHYADNVMDNQMTEFFNGIKDWDKAAEWISKYSTATLPAIAVSKLLQDGKEKDEYPVNRRHGGPISEDGSMGDDYILDDGGRSLYKRSEYIKDRLLSRYNLLPEESDSIIKGLIEKSSLDEKFYDPKHKAYGIGQWSGKDLKEFVLTYKDGGLVDQIDFLAKKYWDGFGKDGKGDIESGVFDEHRWVVKRIGNEEFYTNSPLLKTLPSMSREEVALSRLPLKFWPGIIKRRGDKTGVAVRKHFLNGGETSELQDYIYDRLTQKHGIPPIQAIGIVANLTQESALNYDALGDNGRSYGIQQWQGDRRKKLFEFAKERGREEPALDDQVDFLVEEYKGNGFLFPTRGENMYKTGKTDKDMFDYFQYSKLDFDNAANIYDSTRAWAQGFGRGNKNFLNMDKRFHIAKTLSSRYNIDAGGQSFYTDMGYKDEWGSPVPEVAVSAEKKVAQDDWMEKYGNKMLASILAGDGEGGDTHVTNNYYVNEEGLSEDEKRNAAEVQELQQKQQAQELLASIIDGIKLDIKGVTEVRKR